MAPGAFTKNLLELAPAVQHGLLPGTSGHGATSWVDVSDIAEAAARVLAESDLQGDTEGQTYILTGTHPLSFPEIASILSEELGRTVRYLHLPWPAMYGVLRLSGLPHWYARAWSTSSSTSYAEEPTAAGSTPSTCRTSWAANHEAWLTLSAPTAQS